MTQEAIASLRQDALARSEADPRGAVASYQRLLQLDPSDIDGWAKTGSLLHRLGQHDAAADAFEQVKRLAERANSPEWLHFAQQSIGFVRGSMQPSNGPAREYELAGNGVAGPQYSGPLGNGAHLTGTHLAGTHGTAPHSGQHGEASRPVERRGPVSQDAARASVPSTGGQSEARSAAHSIASAQLAFTAGVGFLTLVVAGAVSQIWHYPYVRAALLRTTDDLLASALCGYLGAMLLLKVTSTHKVIRLVNICMASTLMLGALWFLMSGLMPLSGVFEECSNIKDMKPACNVQLEEYQRLTPEKREELDVL